MSAATEDFDILVSGGGVAGMTAAAAFGAAGFQVICVDPAPPVTDAEAEGADLRSTAFLQPARKVLEAAGLWSRLAPHAAALQVMRIVEAGEGAPEQGAVRDFDAADISEEPFGWNLPNWLLRREMQARLEEMPGVDFRPGTGTASVFTREGEARVTLSDGARIRCRLVIAADGRNSPVREAVGVPVHTTRYGQKALALTVTHPIPHGNVSTEIHRSGGPFTMVPLPDRDGLPHSAVVWLEAGPRALDLAAMAPADLEREMSERSCHLFGPLTLASQVTVWPIISQLAARLWSERVALVAEAAHVVPPIGAQGLNMSLADMACLLDLATARHEGLGDAEMLQSYHRKRWSDIRLRVAGIDALNRSSITGVPALQRLRHLGMQALHDIRPLRRTLMQAGLGAR
ncbi:UbiH/UbiF family hydroxylase [Maritimibacter sp. 55A14]|uniref:UbiH/UbiF family hydroxylase n=1 Tax=Maritimibacter sp. 55A14 TaxID=2174844 RepID=UPI000D60ACF8|nr:UbiH/UbiF family hydroxylase [Maritimibacter sp. 55A14]PWE33662.1 UbiH/UbiF family hydroxylase [Maritimibacter sp. 55A14]